MKQPRGAAGQDLIFFIFLIIVLGIVWALTGGPGRDISHSGPFLNPPFPLGNGAAYTVPSVKIPTSEDLGSSNTNGAPSSDKKSTLSDIISNFRLGFSPKADSPYAGSVTLSVGNVRTTDAKSEYLVIRVSKNTSGKTTVSDWRLVSSVSTNGTALGPAASIPYSGEVNSEAPVAVDPGATIYVVTGRSPTGFSFRTNLCTGYFATAQTFTPVLTKDCPTPQDELKDSVSTGFVPNDACIAYVNRIGRCTFSITGVPGNVGGACQDFIYNDLTYNGCVDNHRTQPGFYKNEWRIYLDRDQDLWKADNDQIRLLDENGKTVASVSY